MMEYQEPNLVVAEQPQVAMMPLVSHEAAREAMTAYLLLCESILTPDDYQDFKQWNGVKNTIKKFKKKSAVKKLQTFFGLSVGVKDVTRDALDDGHYGFRVVATATRRDGTTVEASAGCSTHEERFELARKSEESDSQFEYRQRKALARSYHDILSTAETRATNRAAMNAIGVGGGEVTAEELQQKRFTGKYPIVSAPSIGSLAKRAIGLGICDNSHEFACWVRAKVAGCADIPSGQQPTPEQCLLIKKAIDG